MNKLKATLRAVLEWIILIFLYFCYANIRVIYALHPTEKLDGFRDWYAKDTPNQFATLLMVWFSFGVYLLFGWLWMMIIALAVLGLNLVLLVLWFIRKMPNKRK